ncbi:MAG: PPK2 family polyphosphate kinase [Pseudomonadota bacterium]
MTIQFEAIDSPYLAPTDGSFRIADAPTRHDEEGGKKYWRKRLRGEVKTIAELQRKFYAHDRFSMLLVFQAMDAAGKDSTIRNVLSGVNPAGCDVHSFKRPSSTELDHDFLWRTTRALPERGRIGVFNRSQYEEVLVVRVHPGILDNQKLPHHEDSDAYWSARMASIADQEKHLARNGTVVLKFFLNVSKEAQRQRFIDRLDNPSKQWKFEPNDLRERGYWDDYMKAYESAIAATSKPWAPWYAIPADDKPTMRFLVADIVRRTLEALPITYPSVDAEDAPEFARLREQLVNEKPNT